MSDSVTCPDCGEPMVAGFVLDVTYGGVMAPRWIAGAPEAAFLTGVKTKGKECRQVESFRCPRCGLLRSYATAEVEPPSMLHA